MISALARVSFVLFITASLAGAVVPWHDSLYLGNDGYWPVRIPVTVTNASSQAVAGAPIALAIADLAGTRAGSLRVCRADGTELLFDVRNAEGMPKRAGALALTDRLIVPVECEAGASTELFVYSGNDSAWAVADFLSSMATNANPMLRATIGVAERLHLAKPPAQPRGPSTVNWAEVRVRNFAERPVVSALVRVNLREALARLPSQAADGPGRVSLEDVSVPSYALGQGRELLFQAELPPRSEQMFRIEFPRASASARVEPSNDYERLLESPANLVLNGNMESGGDLPEHWLTSGPKETVRTKVTSSDSRFGKRSLEMNVTTNEKAAWVGWNSGEIPVRAGGQYLLSGWLRAVALQGTATIHVHFHDASGALTRSGAMAGTQPVVSGSSEWLNTKAILHAPPDAASLRLHLTIDASGTVRHDGIVLCEVVDGQIGLVHGPIDKTPESGLHVWEVNPLVKVFPETLPRSQAHELAVELARNEFEPLQLAVRGLSKEKKRLEISVSPLRQSSGVALPPVKVGRVGFVPVDYPSAYYSTTVPDWHRKVPQGAAATDGWAGWWPDPLDPRADFELASSQTQPLWFTVRAPKTATPGDYRGEIYIKSSGTNLSVIPLTARVLPFALPDSTHLRAVFDLRFGPGRGFGSGAESPEQRRRWLQFMAEHRLGIDAIRPEPKFSYQDGKVTMDAREFDEMARVCFDELGMNVCYTPQFFYMFGWAYPPKKFFGLDPFTPEWTAAFKQAYRLFTDHLREKGWHEKFVYYISDEPHFQQDFVVDQMKKLCALIHEVDPVVPIYSSTWRHCAAWDESLDLWGVGQFGCFPVEQMERLQKAGKRFWFTCDGQMATDTPYLATERLLPYYCQKYGAEGFEFWGLAWWTYDPWQFGWHRFIRQSDEGKRFYWVRYPDGDGYLAYPGKPVGGDGPVSTIRLEQIREGLEDYEAMRLLAERVESVKRAGRQPTSGAQALTMAGDLVTIPNAGGLRSTEILPDPDRLPRVRKAVNAALVELGGDF